MHNPHFVVHRKAWLLLLLVVMTLLLGAIAVTARAGIVAAQGPQPQTPQVALGTGFTYQGQLKKNGIAVNDSSCNMTFSLWDSQSGGTQAGGNDTHPVAVTNGLFTVVLNTGGQFGVSAFDGNVRWLQADVKCLGDGSPVTLSRQPLTAAPYALFSAAPWVTSGSGLSYSAGNVGIGVTIPTHKLDVAGDISVYPNSGPGTVRVRNQTSADYSQIVFSDDVNTYCGYLGYIGAAAGLGARNDTVELGSNGKDITFRPDNNEVMRLKTSGGVSIGGDVYIYSSKMTVVGPDQSPNTAALEVRNSHQDVGLQVYDNQTVAIGTVHSPTTEHACYYSFNPFVFASCSSAAEYVPSIDGGGGFPETADLVSLAPTTSNPYGDEHSPFGVTKAAKPCDDNLLGFIVNPASGADGKKLNDHYLPLAIYGYFPAKVTLENGAIKRGDPITSSSKPGHGMKATQACKIIGYALEDANVDGTIQVFANHGENSAPEVAALRTQVKSQAEQIATQQNQIASQQKQMDALSTRLDALEKATKMAGPPSIAAR